MVKGFELMELDPDTRVKKQPQLADTSTCSCAGQPTDPTDGSAPTRRDGLAGGEAHDALLSRPAELAERPRLASELYVGRRQEST